MYTCTLYIVQWTLRGGQPPSILVTVDNIFFIEILPPWSVWLTIRTDCQCSGENCFWNIFKGVFSVWFPNRREDASGENWRREQWRSSPGVDGSQSSAEERSSLVRCFFQDLIGMIANNQIMLRPVEGGDLEMMEQHYRQQNLWKWQQIIVEKMTIMTNCCWKQRWARQK